MTYKIFQQLISQIINAYERKKPNIQINYCANTLQLVIFLKEEGLIRGATIITKPKKLKILVYLISRWPQRKVTGCILAQNELKNRFVMFCFRNKSGF